MTELSHWKNVVVQQRHETGCIPTGYEWIIRYLDIDGVNHETFQEDFDLGTKNNFESVADKIKSRYPHINIQIRSFSQGYEKVEAIRRLIEIGIPCLISLALADIQRTPNEIHIMHKGWHVMPVIHIDDKKIRMIYRAIERENEILEFPMYDVNWRHENMKGGKDIAWIEV